MPPEPGRPLAIGLYWIKKRIPTASGARASRQAAHAAYHAGSLNSRRLTAEPTPPHGWPLAAIAAQVTAERPEAQSTAGGASSDCRARLSAWAAARVEPPFSISPRVAGAERTACGPPSVWIQVAQPRQIERSYSCLIQGKDVGNGDRSTTLGSRPTGPAGQGEQPRRRRSGGPGGKKHRSCDLHDRRSGGPQAAGNRSGSTVSQDSAARKPWLAS